MNRVLLIGNLGKDPEIRTFGENKVATFSLATTETYKDKNGEKKQVTQWHNVQAWRGLAGIIEKYLKKGDKAMIEGKIEYYDYENKQGEKKYGVRIVCENLEMLSPPKKDGNREELGSHNDGTPPVFLKTDDMPF